MNSGNNRSIDMKPNHVKNFDFMSKFYSKPLREYKRPKFGIAVRVCISKYHLPFRKGYKPLFRKENFENNAIATKKLPTYTIRTNRKKLYVGNFASRKEMESFEV